MDPTSVGILCQYHGSLLPVRVRKTERNAILTQSISGAEEYTRVLFVVCLPGTAFHTSTPPRNEMTRFEMVWVRACTRPACPDTDCIRGTRCRISDPRLSIRESGRSTPELPDSEVANHRVCSFLIIASSEGSELPRKLSDFSRGTGVDTGYAGRRLASGGSWQVFWVRERREA
eukprot:3201265-Rhodomonas_salina.2